MQKCREKKSILNIACLLLYSEEKEKNFLVFSPSPLQTMGENCLKKFVLIVEKLLFFSRRMFFNFLYTYVVFMFEKIIRRKYRKKGACSLNCNFHAPFVHDKYWVQQPETWSDLTWIAYKEPWLQPHLVSSSSNDVDDRKLCHLCKYTSKS